VLPQIAAMPREHKKCQVALPILKSAQTHSILRSRAAEFELPQLTFSNADHENLHTL
jgi:hypothetical protein